MGQDAKRRRYGDASPASSLGRGTLPGLVHVALALENTVRNWGPSLPLRMRPTVEPTATVA
jgi:hypothetical protein